MKCLLVFALLFSCVESVRQIQAKSTVQTDSAWEDNDGPNLPDNAESWFVPDTRDDIHVAAEREAGRYGQTKSWFLHTDETALEETLKVLEGNGAEVIGAIQDAIRNAGAPDEDAAVMAMKAAYACGQSFSQDWLNIYAEVMDKPDADQTPREKEEKTARARKLEASRDQHLSGAFKRVLKLSANKVVNPHELSDCHIMINPKGYPEAGSNRVSVIVVDRKLYVPPTKGSGTKKYKACLVTIVTPSPDLPLYTLPTHWLWQKVGPDKHTVQKAFGHWKEQASEFLHRCWL